MRYFWSIILVLEESYGKESALYVGMRHVWYRISIRYWSVHLILQKKIYVENIPFSTPVDKLGKNKIFDQPLFDAENSSVNTIAISRFSLESVQYNLF